MKAEEYIYFERVGGEMPDVLTEKWEVMNRSHGVAIGEIKWYGPWRQYAFFPYDGSTWNVDCLAYISEKIETLHRIRRNVRVNQGKERP